MEIEKGRTRGDGMEEERTGYKQEQQKQLTIISPRKSLQRQPFDCRHAGTPFDDNIHGRKLTTASSVIEKLPALHHLYRRSSDTNSRRIPPSPPKGELVRMKPRLIDLSHRLTDLKTTTKPPKFVPYEPYPGAINPMMPNSETAMMCTINGRKVNKNNLDIGILANQMSSMRTQELRDDKDNGSVVNGSAEELLKLQEELSRTKEERDYFQNQFKFQTNVNSELKNLLVASVGEDLQTRVNVLTEDKLQLARALLDTAKNLTTHTEQIEFLAGQCEVWRSKFLASSVMVEELARWKANLTQKNEMLTESNKKLLDVTHLLRDMQLEILKNLKFLAKLRYLNLPATDVMSLSAENLNIVQQMVLHSGVGIPDDLNISSACTSPLCEAEKCAMQALECTSQPLMATDQAIRAVFEQAQRPYFSTTAEDSQTSTTNETTPATTTLS